MFSFDSYRKSNPRFRSGTHFLAHSLIIINVKPRVTLFLYPQTQTAPSMDQASSSTHSLTLADMFQAQIKEFRSRLQAAINEAVIENSSAALPLGLANIFINGTGAEESPLEILKRLQTPTTSTLAAQKTTISSPRRLSSAYDRYHPSRELRIIGLGSCGTVFEPSQTSPSALAIKKAGPNTTRPLKSLWNDFCLTNRVHNASLSLLCRLQEAFPDAEIPITPCAHCFRLDNDQGFWQSESTCTFGTFPDRHTGKHPAFTLDRIPPVPQPFRDALIDQYSSVSKEDSEDDDDDDDDDDDYIPDDSEDDSDDDSEENSTNGSEDGSENDSDDEGEDESEVDSEEVLEQDLEEIREDAKSDPDNQDCLIRLYLGAKQSEPPASLRNFPLYFDMLEEIGLNIYAYATSMAIGLAAMHWGAFVDGMDTEFVLGGVAEWEGRPHTKRFSTVDEEPYIVGDHIRGEETKKQVRMWILDFDKATAFNPMEDGIPTHLARAFLGNDPYFPRPDGPEELWVHFRNAYLKASKVVCRVDEWKLQEQWRAGEIGRNEWNEHDGMENLPEDFLDAVELQVGIIRDWNTDDNVSFA